MTTNLPPLTGVSPNFGFIGRSLFTADGWLNATIDEFRIYHGRLTPQEIAANFTAGPDALALPMALANVQTPDGLELQWPSYGAGFTLENSPLLAPATWISASPTPVISNGVYRLMQTPNNDAQFFRLKR